MTCTLETSSVLIIKPRRRNDYETTYLKVGLEIHMLETKYNEWEIVDLKKCSGQNCSFQTFPPIPTQSYFSTPSQQAPPRLCEHTAPQLEKWKACRDKTRLVGAKPKKDPTSWRPTYSPKCVYGRSPHVNLAWGSIIYHIHNVILLLY